jgi:hypothetical protein
VQPVRDIGAAGSREHYPPAIDFTPAPRIAGGVPKLRQKRASPDT